MDRTRAAGPWRVFVSRTAELARLPADGSFADAARSAITKAEHAVVDMADFPADSRPPARVCQERVQSADVYIGLIGFRWGSPVADDPDRPPDGPQRSYTELEFDTATAAGTPRLVFILAEDTEGSRALLVDPDHGPRQTAFRARLSSGSGITRAVVRTPQELELAVFQALHELARREAAALGADADTRSAYRQQVGRLAPPQLLGREAELEELVAFCLAREPATGTAPVETSYLWWRADAWAGKSALLSTLVLHPPDALRDRVTLVSFFIYGRLAGQNTREAFLTSVGAQLADLTGRQPPVGPDEGTREAQLLALLEVAAGDRRQAGRRLVLVVDGLDEDRSVTTGPDAHSIVALLPAQPPAGLRVIVAGRPNPPLPDDVQPWHPLRDPRVVRTLDPSPHAAGLRDLAEQELRRLLRGTELERDLLGLLTAARGGLSSLDLQELTAAPLWDIEDVLYSVSGRTFTSRPGAAGDTYLLGHEELQRTAAAYLGEQRLETYRARLHAWADRYREQGWPSGSPAYLLSGYFGLLGPHEIDRCVDYATDAARHDRMFTLTGGDAAALVETRQTLDLVVGREPLDVRAALRVTRHRDRLTDRNADIPAELPGVWARLGHVARGEALASSITEPARRVRALVTIGTALVATGHPDRAVAVAVGAEAVARGITEPKQRAEALTAVASVLLGSGDGERALTAAADAETAAGAVVDHGSRGRTLAAVAPVLVAVGHPDRALTVADGITDALSRKQALTEVTRSLAAAGDTDRARRAAGTFADPLDQVRGLVEIARAAAAAADLDTALAVAGSINRYHADEAFVEIAAVLVATGTVDDALTVAHDIGDTRRRTLVLREMTTRLAASGRVTDARAAAAAITDPEDRVTALVDAARSAAGAAAAEDALALGADAVTTADSHARPSLSASTLAAIAQVHATVGHPDSAGVLAVVAETLAHTVEDSYQLAGVLSDIAEAQAAAGDRGHALALLDAADTVARAVDVPFMQSLALTRVTRALAVSGHLDRALAAAHAVADEFDRTQLLEDVATTLASAGHLDDALTAAGAITGSVYQKQTLIAIATALATAGHTADALTAVRALPETYDQTQALVAVATMLATTGKVDDALVVARAVTVTGDRAQLFAMIALVLATSGDTERAQRLADETEQVARASTDPYQRAHELASAAGAVAAAGGTGPALALAAAAAPLARTVTNPFLGAMTLADVATAAAAAGDTDRALALAAEAEATARTVASPSLLASALAAVARATGTAGNTERALGLAVDALSISQTMTDPGTRVRVIAETTRALSAAGSTDSALNLLTTAETLAATVTDPFERRWTTGEVAEALAAAGDVPRALATTRTIDDPDWLALTLTEVADARVVDEALAAAASIGDAQLRRRAFANVARILAAAGDHDRARAALRRALGAGLPWSALVRVAVVLEPGTADLVADLCGVTG